MTHTNYKKITTLLTDLAALNPQLRELYEKGPDGKLTSDQARSNPMFPIRSTIMAATENMANNATKLMDQCCDEFLADAGSQGQAINPDIKRLTKAMSNLMDVAKEPIPGLAGLFAGVLERCQDWTEQFEYLAQAGQSIPKGHQPGDLSPRAKEFGEKLMNMPEYKDAVADGLIKEPFTWTGTKIDLARLLKDILMREFEGRDYWTYVDNLFSWRGKKLSSKDLQHQINRGNPY